MRMKSIRMSDAVTNDSESRNSLRLAWSRPVYLSGAGSTIAITVASVYLPDIESVIVALARG